MYDIEREQRIMAILKEKGTISVNDLADELFVSGSTIRRNLARMEQKGLVTRTFGGVMPNVSRSGMETAFALREKTNLTEKRTLCQKACELIRSSTTIFIDSSSTCLLMVPYLNNFVDLTIITNGLFLANEIINNTKHKVVVPGGEIHTNTNSIVGPSTIPFLENIHGAQMFMSCTALDIDFGISENSEMQSSIKRTMIHSADQIICLADKSKIGEKSMWKTCRLSDIDILITTRQEDMQVFEEQCTAMGVKIIA